MVNTSTLYQQNKQPPLFQIFEHKKDNIIWILKSISWSGTDAKMWWVVFLRFDYNLDAWVKVFSILTDISFFGKGPDSS